MSTTPYPWSFLQTPKEIWIVYEGGAHIWRKIFMDGRSDFFGPGLGKEYIHLASARYDWEQILNQYRIDMAIVPTEWPLGELVTVVRGP